MKLHTTQTLKTRALSNFPDGSKGEAVNTSLKISSTAFNDGEAIPAKFTCEGDDVNPELKIEGIPEKTASMVLIVEDPDAPTKTWEHWTVVNIDPSTKRIPENSVPGKELPNDFQRVSWGGPCPPSGKPHHYNFRLYAIDTTLELDDSAKKAEAVQAMKGHVLEEAALTGTYER